MGRVRCEEGGFRPGQESRHVRRARRVAAEDAVVAEHVELIRLDVGLLGRLRHLVGVVDALCDQVRPCCSMNEELEEGTSATGARSALIPVQRSA